MCSIMKLLEVFSMADDPQIEVYTLERIAEFLLNNAVTAEEWDAAAEESGGWDLIPPMSRIRIRMLVPS
jgi:hypothetical protein